MEPEPWSVDSVAALEGEVAAAEQRLASLAASIRAATVEVEAARDPMQFREALGLGSTEGEASIVGVIFAGFFCGILGGGVVMMILSAIVRGWGQ
jgi:hypothetical protein